MACEIVKRQVHHMTHLVDDLLDVARISSGRIRLKKELLELEPLVSATIQAFQPTFAAKQQDLTLALHGDALCAYSSGFSPGGRSFAASQSRSTSGSTGPPTN
jgi:signal transduction histidine kinase